MTTEEAMRRIRLITPMLRNDVETAIYSHSTMEAMNDIVPKRMAGRSTPFVEAYHATQNALALKVAMDLARIFDLSNPRRYPAHKQEKASVQVLAALLRLDGVNAVLVNDAKNWFVGSVDFREIGDTRPDVVEAARQDWQNKKRLSNQADCEKAIGDFLNVAGRLGGTGSEEDAALKRLRDFRDQRLAHSLIDNTPEALPRYSDLNLLLGTAKDAARLASFAVEGLNTDFDSQVQRYRDDAKGFADCVVDGLNRARIRLKP
jgi:hypothetical protein